MRLTVPLTGTAIQAPDGTWGGDVSPSLTWDANGRPSIPLGQPGNDPVRIPDKLDLGNVSWQMVSIDWERSTMEIEVTPSPETDEDTGQVDAQGNKIYRQRSAMAQERQAALDTAKAQLESKSHAEHLAASGNKPLKKIMGL